MNLKENFASFQQMYTAETLRRQSIGMFATGINLFIKNKFVKALTSQICSLPRILFFFSLNFKESVRKISYWKQWELKNLMCLVIRNLENACSTVMSAYLQLFKLLALSGAIEPSSGRQNYMLSLMILPLWLIFS